MKKLTYLLLLAVFITSAQTEFKSSVKFSATIANRNSDTITIYGANKFKQVIPVNKKGVFEAAFNVKDGLHQFSDGVESSMIYLKDGDDFSLTMDAKEFDETIVYMGKGADENNFLAQKALKDEQFQLNAFEKEKQEFDILFEQKKNGELESLDNATFDENFRKDIKKMLLQEYMSIKMMYAENAKIKELNGKPSPKFAFENYKGGITKLEDFRGKYVYIDVWATWCAPCRAEIPFLKKIEEKYHDKNIEFVSISIDQVKDKEKWKAMVSNKQLGGVQLFADKDWNSQFVKDYGINGIPRFILIDPNGNVVNASADRPSSESLDKILSELLK